MNLPGVSFALQAPSDIAICPGSISSSSLFRRNSPYTLVIPLPAVASLSRGIVAVSPRHRSANNAGKVINRRQRRNSGLDTRRPFDHFRSLCGTSFKCGATLGEAGDGEEPNTRNVAGLEPPAHEKKDVVLVSGSPVVVVEAPLMLKTAEPMPMMRPNRGLIKPGDAGRVIDRRPKDLWAVRFAVGAYLIDRKCFKPLDVQ